MLARARISLWAVAVVAVAVLFGALSAYQYFAQHRRAEDPELMKGLAAAELPKGAGYYEDWPEWRGGDRTGVAYIKEPLAPWSTGEPKLLWEAKGATTTGQTWWGFSSPAVTDGRVFLPVGITADKQGQKPEGEYLLCLEAHSGKELWRARISNLYRNDYGDGPRAAAAVDGHFASAVSGDGTVLQVHVQDGSNPWKMNLPAVSGAPIPRWGYAGSPLFNPDRMWLTMGGGPGKSVAALDLVNGKWIWSSLDDPPGYSSPICFHIELVVQVAFFTGKALVGIDYLTGVELWRYPWETPYGANVATPLRVRDHFFISSGYGKGCALLKVVKKPDGAFEAQRVWEHNQFCNQFSTSVYYDQHIYGFHERDLACMEFRTGKVRWQAKGFQRGSLIVVNDQLLILGENGKVALAAANPDRYQEISTFQFSRRRCWTAPVVAEGKLFLRDEERLACYELRAEK